MRFQRDPCKRKLDPDLVRRREQYQFKSWNFFRENPSEETRRQIRSVLLAFQTVSREDHQETDERDCGRCDWGIAMSGESEATVRDNEANQPLKSLGKYLIERKLGQGGMGTVYLARHADLKRLIALKVLPRDKAKNPTLVRRFKAEAQAAAHLEHPNIVAVYDTGEADGYLYITMEYVDGIDLFEYLKRRKTVPVKRSIEII